MNTLADALSGGAAGVGGFFKRIFNPQNPDTTQYSAPSPYDDFSMGAPAGARVDSVPVQQAPQMPITAPSGAAPVQGGMQPNVLGSADVKKTANALAAVLAQQMANKPKAPPPAPVTAGSVLNPQNKMLELFQATGMGGK